MDAYMLALVAKRTRMHYKGSHRARPFEAMLTAVLWTK